MSVIGYCSPGIRRIPHLDALLEAPCSYFIRNPGGEISSIAGWGVKPTARRARRIAAARGLPYIALEDGFLRSLDLGVAGAPSHSLVVDYSGIYYDATRPSDLESLILAADFGEAELARARRCMALIRRKRLSKYNGGADHPIEWPDARPRILVVDQTEGDAAITRGGASAQSFEQMLDSALRDHPKAEICVKVHPDVVAGKKRGYLPALARRRGCRLLSEDVSPWALLDAVDEVYVVTSQLGFDALLAGKKVHCFGMPFYAGWGLTRDRQQCPRRGRARTLEQLFCAAYLRYSRYINPYTGERCELEDTIRLLAAQKQLRVRLGDRWLAAGFSPWKRRFVPDFLGRPRSLKFIPARPISIRPRSPAGGRVQFVAAGRSALRRLSPAARVAAWASSLQPDFAVACRKAGLELWRMEDGFLRSVGLGADLVAPLSLVLDSRGIYYDARSPSDLEALLRETDFDGELLARARRLRETLVRKRLSKYNVGAAHTPQDLQLPVGRKVILVPGQVESDASIAGGSPVLKSNRELLQAVRAGNPDALVIYKPHPDVVAGARAGELPGESGEDLFDRQVTDIALPELLEVADELHTLCSLSGFEALLRGVKVVTYGLPFYAGWGVSEDLLLAKHSPLVAGAPPFDRDAILARRGRRLNIDQLVAGALIQYPVYRDPQSGDHIDVETAVRLLERSRGRPAKREWGRALYRLFRNYFLKK